MSAQHEQLANLETTALAHLQDVDLHTPMEQIRYGLEALLDIPTTARCTNTAFSRQAEMAINSLIGEATHLYAFAQSLMAHVNRTLPERSEPRCALSAVGE